MSLLSGLMGHHSEVDLSELQEEFSKILVEGEQIDQAFRLLRDLVVFTSKRIIHVDRQSMTGRKVVYESIPYSEVSRFAVETAGTFDTDSELRIWLRGQPEPIKLEFRRGGGILAVHQALARRALR